MVSMHLSASVAMECLQITDICSSVLHGIAGGPFRLGNSFHGNSLHFATNNAL